MKNFVIFLFNYKLKFFVFECVKKRINKGIDVEIYSCKRIYKNFFCGQRNIVESFGKKLYQIDKNWEQKKYYVVNYQDGNFFSQFIIFFDFYLIFRMFDMQKNV